MLAALAMSAGLLTGTASQAEAVAPDLVAKTAVKPVAAGSSLAASNVVLMKAGKTYSVKIDGKTRKVKLVKKCVKSCGSSSESTPSYRSQLYIGSKKVATLTNTPRYTTLTFRLVKVTTKQTLIYIRNQAESNGNYGKFYRFKGGKLVLAGSPSTSLGCDSTVSFAPSRAGAGKVIGTINSWFPDDCENYLDVPLTYKYSGGKLKRTDITSANNVIRLDEGQSKKVKMNGKTVSVSLAQDGACTNWYGSYCLTYPVTLKIGSVKVISTYGGAEGSGYTIRLVKVSASQTLIEYAPGSANDWHLYRFSGSKLVKVAPLGEKAVVQAGSGRLVLSWRSGSSYQYGLYSYTSGKLKRLA
ncbi:MAG: hypothetical protein LBQ92_01200 [Propionibacteriaceae bacterium]|nr:hypothetical protein [Propionibacteriaceae bacterium]